MLGAAHSRARTDVSVLPQEMAGRALKQTGSRSIEAALEFISKMGYLEPGKEQIVRVVKQTSPGERPGAGWGPGVPGATALRGLSRPGPWPDGHGWQVMALSWVLPAGGGCLWTCLV